MSVSVGRFRPPPVKVSITDGRTQLMFDHPADMWDYLSNHLELKDRLHEFSWTIQEISGGH